ncbi:hypothetical protein MGG_17850 [Pyricularia oryzae 70-15]|uniref:Uncharacterized protein n=1 Tax=Pyricularia oryzae (strain 70-15 / ATCC MYA-4617 / FGSC 8958) TaxID=242507 RepID=G4NJT1_PYRO7|nr:uncharacterized protein MGG_17850 [Pyricularia oryzae 70-15]EHA45748.1 hypothetical protein MGG_17850 [Pyricularia oryzae 70-15]
MVDYRAANVRMFNWGRMARQQGRKLNQLDANGHVLEADLWGKAAQDWRARTWILLVASITVDRWPRCALNPGDIAGMYSYLVVFGLTRS